MITPISPIEAMASIGSRMPDFVIAVVNEMIIENITADGRVTLMQNDIVNRIAADPEISKYLPDTLQLDTVSEVRQYIFSMRWLNFEKRYIDSGWDVKYDKPGFNESGPATFVFKKTR